VEVSPRDRALWEKEVLGFQFGDHPFMEAAAWLAGQLTHDTSLITAEVSGEKVKIAGLVTGVRRILTKTRSQMAVITLEDLHGSIEAVVFPRVYERAGSETFREDAILVIEGKVDTRSERPQVVVDRADVWTAPANGTPPPRPLLEKVANGNGLSAAHGNADAAANGNGGSIDHGDSAEAHCRRVLQVVVPRSGDDNACVRLLEQIHVLVERCPGEDQIQLVLHDRDGGRIELDGADIGIKHSGELEAQVRTLVGESNVKVLTTA
jgi:DNA polymerase-3 subunit alpha